MIPNIILSTPRLVLKGTSDPSQPAAVNFENNQTAYLDPNNPKSEFWAKNIAWLQKNNRPVYIESDEADTILNVYIPEKAVIWKMEEKPGYIDVALQTSSAAYTLDGNLPDFRPVLKQLQTALAENRPILVIATRDFEIIDVRELPDSMRKAALKTKAVAEGQPEQKAVTPKRALEIFRILQEQDCRPKESTSSCIPFEFPQNGCWIRAHLMAHRMVVLGETPKKMICEGILAPHTANSPKCKAGWRWHIAPTLLVQPETGPAFEMIFDPSMSARPMLPEEWRKQMIDPNARLRTVPWTQYDRFGGEASYDEANEKMQLFRDEFQEQCKEFGPPPYDYC